jgi:hypothetical protein
VTGWSFGATSAAQPLLSRHNQPPKKKISAVSQPSAVSAAPKKKTAEHTAEYKMAQNG